MPKFIILHHCPSVFAEIQLSWQGIGHLRPICPCGAPTFSTVFTIDKTKSFASEFNLAWFRPESACPLCRRANTSMLRSTHTKVVFTVLRYFLTIVETPPKTNERWVGLYMHCHLKYRRNCNKIGVSSTFCGVLIECTSLSGWPNWLSCCTDLSDRYIKIIGIVCVWYSRTFIHVSCIFCRKRKNFNFWFEETILCPLVNFRFFAWNVKCVYFSAQFYWPNYVC